MHAASNAGATTRQRAVFVDYDGTYADHGVVPDGHVLAVRAARAAGHRVFLCTGRPRSMILTSVLAELDGFVAGAGGYVDVGGKLLADHRFPGFLQSRPRRGRGVPAPTELSAAGEKALAEAAAQVRALDTKTRQHLGEDYNVLMQILDVLESLPDEPTTGRPRSLSQKDL